ncbi:MAG: FKBP-type peptidyl-prolyl cis-trans isomerase [Bacteroidota bacterium]|nr:FKBP-type peptidyl-prolyl cis-trans isomerase [Bacteroidota bacterium]
MKNFLIAIAGFSAVLVTSCGAPSPYPDYEEAENGTYFILHTKGTGTETVDTGGAVFVKIKFKTAADSVFLDINQATQQPSYPMRVTKSEFKGDFLDMFMRLHAGDSASFFVSLDSLKKYYPQEFDFSQKFGPAVDTMKYLGFTLKVDSIYNRKRIEELRTAAEAENKKQMEMIKALEGQEPAEIAKYIEEKKVTVKPSATGVYYIETAKGKGDIIKSGQTVTMDYTLKFLDGQVVESSKTSGQPMTFVTGQHQVIPGMDEGVLMMKKGGKATLIIPSAQAYGDGGGRMKPYATLVFEIEIVDVKTTMAPPAQPHP